MTTPVVLWATLLYLEVVLRVQTGLPVLSLGLVYAGLFAGAIAFTVHLVTSFIPGRARAVFVGLFIAAVTILYISQLVYYDIFTTFYTVFSATNAGQVTEFSDDVVGKLGENAWWLVLMAVPLILFLLSRIGAPRPRYTWGYRVGAAVLAALLFALAVAGIRLGDRGQNSAYDMYYRQQHPPTSVERLGLPTTMRVDLQRNLLGVQAEAPPPPVAATSPDAPGDDAADEAVDADAEPAGAKAGESAEPEVVEDNVLDIDFEQLAADADSEELRNLSEYFGSREPTAKNDHTGMFEGYNFVFLTAEGFSHLAVDPEVTPTLYKMTNEGIHFTNVWTPLWGVSTSDGEYVATTGLIPKPGVWSMQQSGSNAMPFAMGNQLRKLDYSTYAYHNHTYDYYGRDVSHPNLGYDYKGVGNGLEVTPSWPESDLEMIDVTTPEVLAEEPFHAYYMTVSGHLEYNFGGNVMAAKNRDVVEDLPYGEAGKAYMATQVELDRALELLLERLEEAGVAERTFIALSADHYPYGLTDEQVSDLAGEPVNDQFDLYRNGLIMYAPGMEPETVEEPVSSLDILPTVSNLMGVDYDSRLLMGRDVFSDADPLVIFSDRSFISDKGRYHSMTREFTTVEGAEVPDGYQQAISEEIDRRFYYSAQVLDQDYYRYALGE